MRFGIPPSRSPSPQRPNNKPRGRSTYGLSLYDSSDEDEVEDIPDDSSSSSDSLFYGSDSEVPRRLPNPNRLKRSCQEQKEIDETVLNFRRRGEYEDPFKRWAKDTRTAAFRAATKRYETNPASIASTRRREIELSKARLKESYNRQCEEVTAILEQMNLSRKQEEARLISAYKERDRSMWEGIEKVIKQEEERVRRKLEEEEKARREEQERIKREEERRKAEEERKKMEEKEKAIREEMLRKRKEKEAEEAKRKAEEEAAKQAEAARLDQERKHAGLTTPQEDWETARQSLKLLKEGYLPHIKADSNLRSTWSRGRRAIVPRIGQLTNSQSEIDRITHSITQVMLVQPPHPEPLYISLLSALAKAILMQAETEVSARAVTAIPLAKVTLGLIFHLDCFSDILYARMVQRTGGWAIPIPIGKPATMSEVEYMKLRGYRTEREGQKEFETRVAGIMTLYFAILTSEMPHLPHPLPRLWRLPRLWLYFTRLISTPILLRSDLAMEIISNFLLVGGYQVKQIWGDHFAGILEVLYKDIQATSDAPESGEVDVTQIGASGPEGRAGRVKVLLGIERVMAI